MSRLADLLAEVADEEGLDDEDVAALVDAVRSRRRERPGTELAKRPAHEEIDFPVGPTRGSGRGIERVQDRGVAMYGRESAREAEVRWREQEMSDPEGVLGPGGASAGGIFGDGAIAMADYDPMAHRRSEARAGGQVNVRLVEVLDRVLDRLDRLEGSASSRSLPGRGGSDRLLKGSKR